MKGKILNKLITLSLILTLVSGALPVQHFWGGAVDVAATVNAAEDESYFDEETGTLTLKGTISKASGILGTIILPGDVTSDQVRIIQVDPAGATFPQDSSSLFCQFKNVTSIDLTKADTSSVKSMYRMFEECSKLESLDLGAIDTSSVTDMSWMFYRCHALTSPDLSAFNTSSVTNMRHMFDDCYALTSLDVSNFNTASVTDMGSMFNGCSKLTGLDVRAFDTSSVTDMGSMFNGCSRLKGINLSAFNASSVTDMSYMFGACDALTSLDLSQFDTNSVTKMDSMFAGCTLLTFLDLSSFDTAYVSNMVSMFQYCSSLRTIVVAADWNTEDGYSEHARDMFEYCSSLTGGAGTNYDADCIHNEYARIDGGAENPGYFTAKNSLTAVVINSIDINGITASKTVYAETYTDADYKVPSAPYLDGYRFNGWTVNGTLYKTAEEVKTAVESLVREGTAVTVVTDYEKKTAQCRVTVNNGTLDDGNAQNTVQVSALVKVTANPPESGKKFSHWTRDSIIVSYNTAYSFFMPSSAVTLEAVYVEDETEVQKVGTAIIESVTPHTSAGKVSFVSVVNVPANGTMVRGGLVATSDASIGKNVNDQQYDFLKISSKTTANTKNLKYTWTKSKVTAETIWYVRAYLVYKDANGKCHTVYSNAVKANINGEITY